MKLIDGRRTITTDEYHALVRAEWSEEKFLDELLKMAFSCAWKRCHFRASLLADGEYRTAIQGDKGFPDVILCRGGAPGFGRLLIAELKVHGRKPSPAQREWLRVLRTVPGIEVHIFEPKDWAAIVRLLS